MAKKSSKTLDPVSRDTIGRIKGEKDFVEFLRSELEWPIPFSIDRLDDVVIPYDLQEDFGFRLEEDRIKVSRLLNLTEDQPWGVFLFEFKTKRPYLTHLRRLLRVLGSRRTLREGDPIWNRNDLLFICTPDWREFQFVHFSGEKPESAVLSCFGWTGPEDPFLYTLCKHNLPQLRLPETDAAGVIDPEKWRNQWSDAFSIKPVTDEFYSTLKEVFEAVQAGVKGLKGEDRRFFAELLVNRLIFLKFVEKKGWLDGDTDYLFNRFKQHGRKNYWRNFLFHFFFEGLNTEPKQRMSKVKDLLGNVPFLNAELFAKSDKWDDEAVEVVNNVFDLLFDKLLNPYNFTVCETSPLDVEVAFNQDLLGYGYEELIADQHGQGAYYTHPTEVNLMCRESLRAYLEARCPDVDKEIIGKLVYGELSESASITPPPHHDLLQMYQALHEVTIVDPALGSGTFPVTMMKHLFLCLTTLGNMLKGVAAFQSKIKSHELTDPSDAFQLKLHIIETSLYGCDIDYFAVQIAKLRFWIELMVNCDEPSALPNFDFKLVVGDALVSVVGTTSDGKPIALENILGHPTRGQIPIGKIFVDEYAELKRKYFTVKNRDEREKLRKEIEDAKEKLLVNLGISIPKSRRTDKHVLWQIDFAEIFSRENPGFDIAIANPPYLRQELIDSTLKDFGLASNKAFLQSAYGKALDVSVGGQADLYVYFFLRAMMLCDNVNGVICFICSNSWLDVGYGEPLKKYILLNCEIRLILESQIERSFANAAVNTTINVFLMRVLIKDRSPAVFTVARASLSDIATNDNFRADIQKNHLDKTSRFRRLTVSYDDLATNDKWGAFYLKSPDIFLQIANTLTKRTVKLSSIGKLRRGLTSGCNEFFHLSQEKIIEWNIEQEYLQPICRGPRDVPGYIIGKDFPYMLFVCHEKKESLRGKQALEYIKWGESQKYHKRPTVSVREKWYDVGFRESSQLCMNHRVHRYLRCYFNQGKSIIGDNFHEVYGISEDDVALVFISINSSILQLWIQSLGRVNFGDGLLEFKGYELDSLPVLSPQKSDMQLIRSEFKQIGSCLNQLEIIDLCDECVSRLIGISKRTLEDVRETTTDLIEYRLSKASSMEI